MPTYSPLYDNNFPLNTTRTPLDWALARLVRGNRKRAAIMKALNGVAPGATAQWAPKRVAYSSENGGKRTIETYNLINRATTAADRDLINTQILSNTSRIATPVNKAGPLGTL